MTSTKTRTVAGSKLSLIAGVRYRASRPFSTRFRTAFDVTIQPMDADVPSVVLPALSYDQADKLVCAFNNGATSFDGRIWQ
jgi:hypothetical protein